MPRDDFEKVNVWRFVGAAFLASLAVYVALRSTWLLEQSIGTSDASSNYGYTPDPDGTREFLAELEQPTFRQAGAEVIAGAKGVDAYLYRFADKAHRKVYGTPFGPWNQGNIGTCVSFGWGMGSYIGQCVDWANGQLANPPLLVATEPIYGGSRTEGRQPPVTFAGYSDGSYGAAAARWVSGLKNGHGGILFRQKYGDGDLDLTTYSIPRSKQWGAYGVPKSLAAEANKHTARAVALCETWEGLTAALESGMSVPICSNVGFASGDRDADGFCRRSGNWGHCMVACSLKWAKNSGKNGEPPMKNPRDGVLVINSWGNYLAGGKHPADQPDGSFWITKDDAVAILKQGDSFVIGSVEGFKYRELNHGGWMTPAAIDSLTEDSR
jgi:hypothetical protein